MSRKLYEKFKFCLFPHFDNLGQCPSPQIRAPNNVTNPTKVPMATESHHSASSMEKCTELVVQNIHKLVSKHCTVPKDHVGLMTT